MLGPAIFIKHAFLKKLTVFGKIKGALRCFQDYVKRAQISIYFVLGFPLIQSGSKKIQKV